MCKQCVPGPFSSMAHKGRGYEATRTSYSVCDYKFTKHTVLVVIYSAIDARKLWWISVLNGQACTSPKDPSAISAEGNSTIISALNQGGFFEGVEDSRTCAELNVEISKLLLWTRNAESFSFLTTAYGKNLACRCFD